MAGNSKRKQQRKERSGSVISDDDTAKMKQVRATHRPDGHEIVIDPIIQLIEGILRHVIVHDIDGKREGAETLLLAKFDNLDSLVIIIHRISCELSYKCSVGEEAHETTMVLLNTLSTYPWHTKVVLALAAFVVNFGKFWLVAQQRSTNTLANSVAILEQLPDRVESSLFLKLQFDALNELMKAALDITKSMIEFKALPSQCVSEDAPPMSDASAHIPIAVYWTIRSSVALSSQITSFVGFRKAYPTIDTWELSTLVHKINVEHKHLKNQLALCYKYINDKIYTEMRYKALKTYFQKGYVDKKGIPSELFGVATDPHPLVEANKTTVGVEVLREKHVLLLISDLDISLEEIRILDDLYKKAKERQEALYEIVWIPVGDKLTWNDKKKVNFEYLQSIMTWYSVRHPLRIHRSVIKYIREDWNFSKRPIVVALDPQARVCSTDALHMIWIWGNMAFPFTREKEESLWKNETWSLELIVNGIFPSIIEWMTESKHICLYGSKDIEWLRTFTYSAASVARAANIKLEMLYVGKSNAKEHKQRMVSTLAKENFIHILPDGASIWFFWARLKSMLYSKLQQNTSEENDVIMSEVMTILSFDRSDTEWALLCKGTEMAVAHGANALKGLKEFENWKETAERDGVVPAFREYLKQIDNMSQNPIFDSEFKSTRTRKVNGGITSMDDVSGTTGMVNNLGARAPGQFNQSVLNKCQIILQTKDDSFLPPSSVSKKVPDSRRWERKCPYI